MYFAQLDKDSGECFVCYVSEEIEIDDDIKFYSDSEEKVEKFCEDWNSKLK